MKPCQIAVGSAGALPAAAALVRACWLSLRGALGLPGLFGRSCQHRVEAGPC